jgi:F420-0:gamma-glutamyl ligase
LNGFQPNDGKSLTIEVEGITYARLPEKTQVITAQDRIDDMVTKYVLPHIRKADLVFISERVVAISQGRAFPINTIEPSWLARFLVKFVHKSPHGIGLGSPWTMELALREAGAPLILFAAFISAVTKLFGIKGVFYMITGKRIAAIDGPCDYTLPPYNKFAKLGPKDPNKVARQLKKILGCEVVIIDANDLGVSVLGRSSRNISEQFCKQVFRDNPLGQSSQQTPIAIVRKIQDQ